MTEEGERILHRHFGEQRYHVTKSVPKRRKTTICRRGNTQKNTYKIQYTAKVWNQEIKSKLRIEFPWQCLWLSCHLVCWKFTDVFSEMPVYFGHIAGRRISEDCALYLTFITHFKICHLPLFFRKPILSLILFLNVPYFSIDNARVIYTKKV